jgi:hypothetical protein
VIGLPASCSFWNAFQGIIEKSHGASFLDFNRPFFRISHSFLLLLPNSSQEEINEEKDAGEKDDAQEDNNGEVVISSVNYL